RLVFLANPNNPTSTMISHTELKEFMRQIPPDVYVVSDEAYAEYITADDYPDTLELQKIYPSLLIFKTFSKIYGLAGLRIGYAVTHPDVIKSLLPYKMPFSVTNLAAIAASAALDDTEYMEKCATINAEERDFLYTELSGMGFDITVPHGNFVFIDLSSAEEREKVDTHLRNKGISVRPLEPFGSETALRITVGQPEENRHLIKSLKQMK
ncbi:aminotransferase class I/II-fold pyridoxal phosphate-dependent enzyme, partial [bacterium]|nr:aminotransferase class I/II-fold pyridoxal phosphate-dependent enzyme [bacterium]